MFYRGRKPARTASRPGGQSIILCLITILSSMSFAFSSFAAAPTNIVTYQGRLLNSNSVPVSDTSLSMRFFFYTAVTGGTCVWSNSSASCDSNTPASTTARTVTLTSGLFTQNLGDTGDTFAAIGDSIFADNSTLFLEVIVGSETLSPRRRLTAAPYALNAQTLDGLSSADFLRDTGDTATGAYTFSGAITFDGANTFNTDVDMTFGTSENFSITNSTSTTNTLALTVTAADTHAQQITFTLGNDANADSVAALSISVSSAATGDADQLVGVSIADLTGADATVTEAGLLIGSGWDSNIMLNDTTSIISVANGGSITFNDQTNTLMTLTDSGTVGNLNLTGTATVGDLSCTNCLDFSEFIDAMSLDASTSIALSDAETLTFTNGGTGNIITNLSSTGDFVVQDNGTAVLTIADDDAVVYSTDLATSTAFALTGNSLTTGNLLNLTSTALTTGSALLVTATNANTANSATRLSQFNFTNSQATLANTDVIGLHVSFTNNPSVLGNTERVVSISNAATANTTDNAVASLLALDNGDSSVSGSTVVTDAIAIAVTGGIAGGIIDAIDASDANITNALNFGVNVLLGTTGNIDMDNFDVVGSTGSITTAGDIAVNGGDITSSGTLTIDSSGTIQLGTDDDFLPQLGAGDADLGSTGARWDNVNAVTGSFSGVMNANDFACTNCLDFSEFIDAMSLDAPTSIAMDGAETFTITNAGTANIIYNLTSTGDFVVQDAGSAVFTITDAGAINVIANAAPATDLVTVSNSGQAITTTDVNAMALDVSVTNVSSAGLFVESTYAGGATDGLSYSAFFVNDISPTNAAGIDSVIGVDVGAITDPGTTINSFGLRVGTGYDANIAFADSSAVIDLTNTGTLGFGDGTNTLMLLTDSGTAGTLTINNIATTAAAVNIYDDAVTKTIDIGGVTNDAADTINIATNATSGDTINIGNALGGTNVTLTAGGTIDLEGAVTIDLTTIAATQFAVCHTNSDTNDEPIGDCSGAPTADYAEQYPVETGISYGDIVVPGAREVTTTEGHTITSLVKSSEPYQGPIVGIVSDNYGDFTSAGYNIEAGDNPMPVALVGRVPVKVTDEGGAIHVGDYLTTSSSAGRAMKASKVGRVIGMALQDWDGVSDTVMVQVHNSWYMGEVIGTDGVSTLVTDNVVVSSFATATAEETTFDSYGLSLRGSAWNGSEAEAVEMMLQNVVESEDDYRLSVRNTTETEVAYITQTGTMKIAGDMVIGGNLYPSDRGVAQTEKYIYYDGSEGAAGDFMRTNAKGWSTGSYDFAEMFPSTETLQAGEVVAFSGTGHEVQRATGREGEQLAGIVSTRPGFLAGENVEGSYPIALAGRVPTKVSADNGAIAVGDPLTSSTTSGVAVKATENGQIVGYALEAFDGTESDDLVLVYVNIGHWAGEEIAPVVIVNNIASEISGNTNFSALNMSGNISMNSYEISGIGALTGMGDAWSLTSDGSFVTTGLIKTVIDSYQNEKVETVAVTSPEVMITLTGTATLVQGQVEIRFENVIPEYNDVISAIAPIRVFVTPNGPVSLYVSEKDQNHFVVTRFLGDQDVEFDWMVSAYRKGYEPVEEVDEVEEVDQVDVVDPGFSLGATQETVSTNTELETTQTIETPASPESPDTTLVDPATDIDGGATAEPPIPSP